MNPEMDLSILIPTKNRLGKLGACVQGLAQQDLVGERFEVLVGIDGPDQGESDIVAKAGGAEMRVIATDGEGPASVRNVLLNRARGRLVLWLNDDVIPGAALARLHVEAHEELGDAVAMVLGQADFVVPETDSMMDLLTRQTSMIFFYDQMQGVLSQNPAWDWGFRHAWTLNLSMPASAARGAGGFCEKLTGPCYEDIEFAWRMRERFESPVLYRPEARVQHDHRILTRDYLQREFMLGKQAWNLAATCPECAQEVFGRDLMDAGELRYSAQFFERERTLAARLCRQFVKLDQMPALCADGGEGLVELVYQQHLLLKRWVWRLGFLAAGDGQVDAMLNLEALLEQDSADRCNAPADPDAHRCLAEDISLEHASRN